ncbi:MAG: Rieske 2Fe-2S domain-containing protein [Sandaracinaceae bacterium]
MSHGFVTVQWTRRKVIYDVALVATVAAYLGLYPILSKMGQPRITPEIVSMRAWGSCAFLMLTLILSIGPLARLDKRFLPLLYNRRHFGVLMFVVALGHLYFVQAYYYAYSPQDPLVSILTQDTVPMGGALPFPLFGLIALAILFLMALTSHDFWQKALGPRAWKRLHMAVYVAYFAVVLHVAFGAFQWETSLVFVGVFLLGAAAVSVLHVLAASRSNALDAVEVRWVDHDGGQWIDAGPADRIPDGRALPVVNPNGERIAVVRDGDLVTAIHGVCAHQGGPLYEGKVLDGCLTCPWHGWQYRTSDGQSPPPFEERLPTYRVALAPSDGAGGAPPGAMRLLVDPTPQPPGTRLEPVRLSPTRPEASDAE